MGGNDHVSKTYTDCISNLPEDVIGEILSRLSTEDAVKTCVLSKNWKYKWTFINQIIIDEEMNLRLRDLDHSVFVKCVERTLGLVQNATKIKINLLSNQSSDVPKAWMDSLSRHTVEELELYIEHGNIVLSSSLLNVTKLRRLVVTVPSFAVSSKNHFPNLTDLRLSYVKVMNQNAGTDGTLMFTFPVLKTLELIYCRWFNVKSVEIHAPVLNSLSTVGFAGHDYTISIYSARLADFVSIGALQVNLLNGSAAVKLVMLDDISAAAGHDILQTTGVKVRRLLRQISLSLNLMCLSMSLAQAILESKQGYSYPLKRLDKLEYLSLHYHESGRPCGIQELLELLHAAPALIFLSIDLAGWTEFDRDTIESVPSCITTSLKLVELTKYSEDRPYHGLEKLFQEAGVIIKRCQNEEDEIMQQLSSSRFQRLFYG